LVKVKRPLHFGFTRLHTSQWAAETAFPPPIFYGKMLTLFPVDCLLFDEADGVPSPRAFQIVKTVRGVLNGQVLGSFFAGAILHGQHDAR
jgi:hypothetical protein